MKPIVPVLTAILLFMVISGVSQAGQLKTHVAEFSVAGAPNRDELKVTLQGILSSRLNPSLVQLVEKPEQAELLVIGSYALFGKVFSLDVLLKNSSNGTLTKVFEQGEGQDDLIPAIGRLARKIDAELAKTPLPAASVPKTLSSPAITKVEAPLPVAPSPAPAHASQRESYTIRPEPAAKDAADGWTSAPLEGVFSSVALGRTLPSGERELFVADARTIRAYLKGDDLKLVAEVTIPAPAQIITIDTADLDSDGTPELYVTIMDRESLSSRVYLANGAKLSIIAENLPWFFRGIGQDVKTRIMYSQEMETGGKFYGGVAELVKSGNSFTTRNPQQLPRSGNIFNFNRMGGASGKGFFVVLNEDGYLVISSPDGTEVWKSSDKFGGSENNFKHKSIEQLRSTGDQFRWTFLEQRIVITPEGDLLVPYNAGGFSIGNNRDFNKYTLFALHWNGSVLKEKWHTRQVPSYLADYAFDPASREVVLLEVVQKAGLFTKGKTVITINRID